MRTHATGKDEGSGQGRRLETMLSGTVTNIEIAGLDATLARGASHRTDDLHGWGHLGLDSVVLTMI